ncbi:MAG: hypothetical protein AAF236_07805, partial [Verrucomicrobiota bacterium]
SASPPPCAPATEPSAWEQMDEWLDVLEDENLIEESSLEELRENISELRQQPEEEWFSHSSLEATDNLRETLGQDIRDLASDLDTLERDLAALQQHGQQMSEEAKQKTLEEYDEALDGLSSNGMEVNESLREQLGEIDPSQLGQQQGQQMSSEQMEQLQQQLSEGSEALGSMEGLPDLQDAPFQNPGDEMMPMAQGGAGGIDEETGQAPLFFGEEQDLGTDQVEGVSNQDFSRASLGELLEIGETQHRVDESSGGSRTGGAAASNGSGGDAVWRESLMPSEQAVLKRYFK